MFITKWHTFRLLNNKVSLQANKNSIQPLLRLSNIRTFNANNLAQEIRFIISFIKIMTEQMLRRFVGTISFVFMDKKHRIIITQ